MKLPLRRGSHLHLLAVPTEEAEDLYGLVSGCAEPVWNGSVELRHLSRPHRHVVVGKDQSQSPREDVQPFVTLVRPKLRLAWLRRDHDFPCMESLGLIGQRHNDATLSGTGSQTYPWVAHRWRPDQLIERHLMRLSDRQQQLQARLALPGLQTRQGAL